MRAAVVTFPGSNGDRDLARAFERATGAPCARVWHGERELPAVDVVGLPGGFSYGDYLRCGAIAARSPIMAAVRAFAEAGGRVLGVCNGFQVLCEAQMLPGALMGNRSRLFVSRWLDVAVTNATSDFTRALTPGDVLHLPVAHHDGAYTAEADELDVLEGEGRVALRYLDNPNGSKRDIAGVLNSRGNVLGLMPHPERAIAPELGGADGLALFRSLVESLA
ncbi:MAG: phosphoribosylformylglycinamidine synthase subunit PurQ [Alphaproteobacteria bacterium]